MVRFAYDEAGHLVGEYDADGDLIEETVWFGDLPVATIRPDGTSGIEVYYVHTDHLNTPRRITDPSDNTIIWRWDSEPYGATAADEDPDADTNLFTYNLRFPGQYFDDETGLHYNYLRDYDAVTGRYVESDPIGLGGGINTFAYARANPLVYTDRTGEFADALVDLGFIAYDLYRIVHDNLLDDCDNTGENLAALGADTAGLFIPFGTGFGLGVRAERRLAEAARDLPNASTLYTRGYQAAVGERTIAGYVDHAVSRAGGELTVIRPSGREAFRIGPGGRHGIDGPHVHPRYRNVLPDGEIRQGISGRAIGAENRHLRDLYRALDTNAVRTSGGR